MRPSGDHLTYSTYDNRIVVAGHNDDVNISRSRNEIMFSPIIGNELDSYLLTCLLLPAAPQSEMVKHCCCDSCIIVEEARVETNRKNIKNILVVGGDCKT